MNFRELAWCLGLPLVASTCFAQTVTLFDVPGVTPIPGRIVGTFPKGINNRGYIVGTYCCDAAGEQGGFLRDPDGNFTTFAGLLPISINDRGVIAGDTSNLQRIFTRDRHGNIDLYGVPGVSVWADVWTVAENDKGEIAGGFIPQAVIGGTVYDGLFLQPNDPHQQGTFGLPYADIFVTGINIWGDITGFTKPYDPYKYNMDGFVRDREGTVTTFEAAPEASNCISTGTITIANGINNFGEIAGEFTNCSSPYSSGFLRFRNGSTELFQATQDAVYTTVAGINNRGVVAGSFLDPNLGFFEYLRDSSGHTIVFEVPGIGVVVEIAALNDHSDVIGYTEDQENPSIIHGWIRKKALRYQW
jgi:hypothetical protein